MTVQTSYAINTDARFHGGLADLRDNEIVTKAAEATAIGFGIVVQRGTTDKQAVLGGDDAFYAITVKDMAREANSVTDPTIEYKIGDPMSLLKRGAINLTIPSGGTEGDPLKYVDATGVIDAGAPAAGETAIPGATLEETVAAGEVAEVRLSGQN